jgi:hypothetical protein
MNLRDKQLVAAAEKGIYVDIILFESADGYTGNYHPFRSVNNINGFDADPSGIYTLTQPATLVRQKAFVAKVIDTVNDLDNVLYEIGNELPFGSLAGGGGGWQNAICDYIHTYEAGKAKQHPVGITTPAWDGGTGSPYNNLLASHADFIAPTGHDGNNFDAESPDGPPVATGNKIHILDTDHIDQAVAIPFLLIRVNGVGKVFCVVIASFTWITSLGWASLGHSRISPSAH